MESHRVHVWSPRGRSFTTTSHSGGPVHRDRRPQSVAQAKEGSCVGSSLEGQHEELESSWSPGGGHTSCRVPGTPAQHCTAAGSRAGHREEPSPRCRKRVAQCSLQPGLSVRKTRGWSRWGGGWHQWSPVPLERPHHGCFARPCSTTHTDSDCPRCSQAICVIPTIPRNTLASVSLAK